MLPKLSDALKRMEVEATPCAVASSGKWQAGKGEVLLVHSPVDGSRLAAFRQATPKQLATVVGAAHEAFLEWRTVPAPTRGQFVRRLGELLRQHKDDLATIVAWEVGKIAQEALGEVQEMIDICEFALGLSRQLYGKTIATERPQHRMMEQWHPLGAIGVLSAFNFPVAVWSWNAMLALVCGDSVVWKPSEKTPLAAIACQKLIDVATSELGFVPPGVTNLVIGGADVGQALAADTRLPLISATGSTAMGKAVAQTVAARLGHSLLELGGNNAMIVTPSADLALAERAILFAAVGTCGQRCTTLRRLIVHESIAAPLLDRLSKLYEGLPIGHPLEEGVLVGPLIDARAAEEMQKALGAAIDEGGRIVVGGGRATGPVPAGGHYVRPAIVEIDAKAAITQHETFAPILYVIRYRELDEAIRIHNDVPQGLSSAIFTGDVREAEEFVSATGSDCGIANVNIGTSGAEIGGAFGGEKETGGGRESGSDSWKAYMRRTTNTINYSDQLPLAQGIRFDTTSS
jgi:L-aminoadipate-semialdehyde dehydrogenase